MNDYGITKIYRLSRKCYEKNIPLIPKILKLFIRIFFSATIPYQANIGYGTKFPHAGQGVVVNEKSVIGKNCIIGAGTIIGGKGGSNGAPQIGDNVTLGANCCVIGEIKIGNNSIVGAGAVVTKNFESNVVIAGNPAKIIKNRELK